MILTKIKVMAKIFSRSQLAFSILFVLIVALALPACEGEVEKVEAIENFDSIPQIGSTQTQIIYSDSAVVKMRLTANELYQYMRGENQRTEFPSGVIIEFFDKSKKVVSSMEADRSIYYEKNSQWEFYDNVQLINDKNDTLRSSRLFIYQDKEKLSSDTTVVILRSDGTYTTGTGFNSDYDFYDAEFDEFEMGDIEDYYKE